MTRTPQVERMIQMMVQGYVATVSSGYGNSLSRTYSHPETAFAQAEAWVNAQLTFAVENNIKVTSSIKPVQVKRIGTN